ncbi:hypothetical protein OH77DRAFT_1573329 [Trametes cingulata]|nr:hypothetical protein OH77DRAFT_1573329 [Trametes cingulata]
MGAACRWQAYIVHLKEDNNKHRKNHKDGISDDEGSRRPNLQRGFKGHIIIHPQRPEQIDNVLPPTVSDIITPICVIFVGSMPPTLEWLKKHAKPLAVRREKVRSALEWLRHNNALYDGISVDEERLAALPEDGLLPVHIHIEHVMPTASDDALTSRYDANVAYDDEDLTTQTNTEERSEQKVVITDVDGRSPANELRAAAVRHIKERGGGYVEVPHGPVPLNEFCNPELFPMLYPCLFPYGIGGCEDPLRARPLSLHRHIKHLITIFQHPATACGTIAFVSQSAKGSLSTVRIRLSGSI